MLKKLLNFYLFRKFRIPEIDRHNAKLSDQYDRFIKMVTLYNEQYGYLMSHLIIKDPMLYNQIAELEDMSKRIEHLADGIESNLRYGSDLVHKNLL